MENKILRISIVVAQFIGPELDSGLINQATTNFHSHLRRPVSSFILREARNCG